MKGNEALAISAIRYGCDGYFGYPITPQSEVLETLEAEMPWETTGMVVLQAESELASINMVFGGAACGKAVFTSSSSPGLSLMQEGISYLAAAELPALVVNVMRGGPGLGTIHPSQSDYFQATKGGGHGDYHCIVLAPASVQEMADFVWLGWDLAFKYRTPAIILSDGVIGQMMEKVVLPEQRPRRGNSPTMPLGSQRPKRSQKAKYSALARTRLCQDGAQQHALPGNLPQNRSQRGARGDDRHRQLRLLAGGFRKHGSRVRESERTRCRRWLQSGPCSPHHPLAVPLRANRRCGQALQGHHGG